MDVNLVNVIEQCDALLIDTAVGKRLMDVYESGTKNIDTDQVAKDVAVIKQQFKIPGIEGALFPETFLFSDLGKLFHNALYLRGVKDKRYSIADAATILGITPAAVRKKAKKHDVIVQEPTGQVILESDLKRLWSLHFPESL